MLDWITPEKAWDDTRMSENETKLVMRQGNTRGTRSGVILRARPGHQAWTSPTAVELKDKDTEGDNNTGLRW